MPIELCKPVTLPVIEDRQGNLAFAEAETHVPFPIARVFYVYDLPSGAVRGGHAHLSLEQVVFCVAGRLELRVRDGERSRTVLLDDPREGLYLPPLVWHDIGGFAPGTIYVVMASAEFDEGDYVRDYDEFLVAARATPTA